MVYKYKKWNMYEYCLLFVVLWCISPPLFISGSARIVALICMIVALKIRYVYNSMYFSVLIFFIIYTLGIGIFKQGIGYLVSNIQTYIILAIAYIVVNKTKSNSSYNFSKIVRVIQWIYPIWMLITLRAYNSIPNISRILANNNNENVALWSRQGIGGYGMIYSLVFYNIILLYILVHKKYRGILTVINYILSLITIALAGYSIALIGVLLGSVIIIFVREKKMGNIILVALIILFTYVLFVFMKDEIFSGLLDLTQGTMYEQKMIDIVGSFYEDSPQGTLKSRTVLYDYSMDVFKNNPFVGSALSKTFMFGGHSFLLDMFAKFGVLGGIPFVYLLFYFPISCIRKNKEFSLSLAILILMIFIGGLNNLSAAFAPMVYVVYPAIAKDD